MRYEVKGATSFTADCPHEVVRGEQGQARLVFNQVDNTSGELVFLWEDSDRGGPARALAAIAGLAQAAQQLYDEFRERIEESKA